MSERSQVSSHSLCPNSKVAVSERVTTRIGIELSRQLKTSTNQALSLFQSLGDTGEDGDG